MAAGYFDAATALDKFGADSLTNAVLLNAVQNGAFVADTATRALFADNFINEDKLDPTVMKFADVKLTSAEVKALKATPITLIAAPGADLAVVPISAVITCLRWHQRVHGDGRDLSSAGPAARATRIETCGFIDQASDETLTSPSACGTFEPKRTAWSSPIWTMRSRAAPADNEIHSHLLPPIDR